MDDMSGVFGDGERQMSMEINGAAPLDAEGLEKQGKMARTQVRKMETEGAIPKMTACTIKIDAEGSVPAVRILLRRLPLPEVHPVSKLFLVPMAVARIRFAVERHSGVTTEVTCSAHEDVYGPGEFDEATTLVMKHAELRIAVQLTPLNEEFLEDFAANPQYIALFARLAQVVDERIKELLASLGVIPRRA